MTPATLITFFYGIAFACSLGAATFFVRFWSSSRDPLFAWFAAAFGLLGFHWAALVGANPAVEARPYFYLIRLVAFVLIIVATVQKNRGSASR
jgi:hypothetical protein